MLLPNQSLPVLAGMNPILVLTNAIFEAARQERAYIAEIPEEEAEDRLLKEVDAQAIDRLGYAILNGANGIQVLNLLVGLDTATRDNLLVAAPPQLWEFVNISLEG